MKKKEIIKDIENLCKLDFVNPKEIDTYGFNYEPIFDYLHHLTLKSKPETAASELVRKLLADVLEMKDLVAEVNFDNSFVDYVIYQKGLGNPILVELKLLHSYDRAKETIRKNPLSYSLHKNQIQKYLRNKKNEYIIFTNIETAYIFNREALINFEPFFQSSLTELLSNFLLYGNFWDTIRRLEDNQSKVNLDKEFFESLETWIEDLNSVEFETDNEKEKKEIVVLLLNKFIFIKTLEDYGLIEYKFLESQYEDFVKKWSPKGFKYVFNSFFREIEDFFNIYYDTELFKTNIWKYVKRTGANIERFRIKFEQIMGLDLWSKTYSKGLVHFNYRQINEDIFGKAYETWLVEKRKDSGVYYTPVPITEYMSLSIVESLFEQIVSEICDCLKDKPNIQLAEEKIRKLKSIRIIDPCSGSGSFLIKVLRNIYNAYLRLCKVTEWSERIDNNVNIGDLPHFINDIRKFRKEHFLDFGNKLKLMSSIILNHIFAADKDERALETAKTNLWKEAVKIDPQNYNYLKLNSDKAHILPNLELNFIMGDSLIDMETDSQLEIISEEFKTEIIELHEIRNKYINDPFNVDVVDKAFEIKQKIKNRLKNEIPDFDDPLFYCLEYFFCFFDEQGNILPAEEQGFSGVTSNPPWDAVKPVRKEFARLNKYDMDILHFNDWFNKKLHEDGDFKEEWEKYCQYYSKLNNYLGSKFIHQGAADHNYYKYFIERDINLLQENGCLSILVPSGFQTDLGSKDLRKLLIVNNTLVELLSFENKGYFADEKSKKKQKLFPDVHPQFKFSIIKTLKTHNTNNVAFESNYYMHSPQELYSKQRINYTSEMIEHFSPANFSIMEFRDWKDYELCKKIYHEKKTIEDINIVFRREFDMTNDSSLFHAKSNLDENQEYHCLYEGRMIHQYSSDYGIPKYFLEKQEAHKVLLRKVKHRVKSELDLSAEEMNEISGWDKIALDYQSYRLVYRDIASSTNERTFIASIVKPNVFLNNKLIHIVNYDYNLDGKTVCNKSIDYSKLIFLMAMFNSLVLNYYLRNKISTTLNMFYIYELPLAETNDDLKRRIIEIAFSLLYRKSNRKDFEDLKKELKVEPDIKTDLINLRAELEIIIAKNLYGLDKKDWDYLTSTFTFGSGDTKHELDEIIKLSKEMF